MASRLGHLLVDKSVDKRVETTGILGVAAKGRV
jgi:hypothetical protein